MVGYRRWRFHRHLRQHECYREGFGLCEEAWRLFKKMPERERIRNG